MAEYIAPELHLTAFNCQHCTAFAYQIWVKPMHLERAGYEKISGLDIQRCIECGEMGIWYEGNMIYPASSVAELPLEDMPEDVKSDFNEARNIVNASPRSAAALLRLAIQKLMLHLGEKGNNLNDDIGNLVKRGLPLQVQKALDAVRVVGNNALDPGKLDIKDDKDTALKLFNLLNAIIRLTIVRDKLVEELYDEIPESNKEAIKKKGDE